MTRTALAVTRRPRFLSAVPSEPPGQEWIYQLARAFQLSPTEIGLVANIRRCHVTTVDLEEGSDLVIVDRIDPGAPKAIVPMNRNSFTLHPRTGERIVLCRYPLTGGFVPLGALRADGTPHPHAGTGFATACIIGFPVDAAGIPSVYGVWDIKDRYHAFEFQQYRYDGARFVVEHSELVEGNAFLSEWQLWNEGLGNFLPDGDDLIGGLVAHPADGSGTYGSGLARWQRRDGRWRLAAFTPVTGPDGSFEPSLVREADGTLLFAVRGGGQIDFDREKVAEILALENDIRVWRSADGGAHWELILHERQVRAGTPVTINKATDGTVYMAGNPHRETDSLGRKEMSIQMRETLLLWPLAEDRRSLLDPVVARDCPTDFGSPPHGSIWRTDHPVGLNVRLRDGRWHHLLIYRVLEQKEGSGGAPATAHTGTYVEEVTTPGPAAPEWRFK